MQVPGEQNRFFQFYFRYCVFLCLKDLQFLEITDRFLTYIPDCPKDFFNHERAELDPLASLGIKVGVADDNDSLIGGIYAVPPGRRADRPGDCTTNSFSGNFKRKARYTPKVLFLS